MNHRKTPAASALAVAVLALSIKTSAAPEADKPPAPAASTAASPPPQVGADPWSAAYSGLERALGKEGLSLLASKGYLAASPEARRVFYVQWAALEPVQRAATALASLADSAAAFRAKGEAPVSDEALRTARSLPTSGLLTPAVKAAAAILSEARSHRQALAGRSLGTLAPLYRTAWGKPFSKVHHAQMLDDSRVLVQPFFDELLAGPDRVPEALEHVKAYLKLATQNDAGASLDGALVAGAMPEALQGALAEYLADQRRWARLAELRDELADFERHSDLQKELANLQTATQGLSGAAGVLDEVKAALPEPAQACVKSPGAACVNGGDLHLQTPLRGDSYELGDKSIVSAAYWIDGLSEKDSVPVTEIGFLDRGEEGMQEVSNKTQTRRNGGPYAYLAPITIADTRAFTYKLILGAQGTPLVKAVTVSPSTKFEDALHALAKVHDQVLACGFQDGAAGYAALQAQWGAPEKNSPWGQLASALPKRSTEAYQAAAAYDKLTQLMPVARMDASAEACAFRTDRAEKAWALLADLPAGCSKSQAEEAEELLRSAGLRRNDQDDFDKTLASAQGFEKDCRFRDASARYAAALALLDADREAHCGRWESAYREVLNDDLPRSAAAESFQTDIDKTLAEAHAASAGGDHAKALGALLPLISRIDALPNAKCWDKSRRDAEQLAVASGVSLPPAAADAVASRLPPDDIDGVLAEIKNNKARLDREAAQRAAREVESQAPVAPAKPAAGSSGSARPATAEEGTSGPAVPPAVEAVDAPASAEELLPASPAPKTSRKTSHRKKTKAKGRRGKAPPPTEGSSVAPDAGPDPSSGEGR